MPIEQERGRPRPNSDIYAFMIGIQALTGSNPTQLLENSDTGDLLTSGNIVMLASVLKMVRYHKDRYQTAAEALQALQLANLQLPTKLNLMQLRQHSSPACLEKEQERQEKI